MFIIDDIDFISAIELLILIIVCYYWLYLLKDANFLCFYSSFKQLHFNYHIKNLYDEIKNFYHYF
jgi:hypothetical protein